MEKLKAVEILSRYDRQCKEGAEYVEIYADEQEIIEALSELQELTQEKSCEGCAIAYTCKTFQTLKNANVLIGDENLVCNYYTPKG